MCKCILYLLLYCIYIVYVITKITKNCYEHDDEDDDDDDDMRIVWFYVESYATNFKYLQPNMIYRILC